MGGFFGAYVVFHLILLGWAVGRGRERRARTAGIGFALFTVLMAHVPQSHELRYYLCWMMVLVSLNLWLIGGVPDGSGWKLPALGAACAVFLGAVLAVTRGIYVYPSGMTFAELMREGLEQRVVAGIRDGEKVCLRREPYTFLYGARFHPGRRYLVQEVERPEECGEARWVP
jgi:hypothetical protein